jgi:hypothetical protein
VVSLVAAIAALIWELRTSRERISLRVRPRPRLSLVSTAPVVPSAAAAALTPEPVLESDRVRSAA